jgi:nucleoside-diphosphate-sugar epimerase
MKNVLIIGGSYFVGRVFVEELLKLGDHAVHVMNRGNRLLNLGGVNEIRCDRHDSAAVAQSVPPLEWHAVVDFVAYEPTDVETLIPILPGSIGHYVYISTATVCETGLKIPMTEDSPKLTSAPPIPGGDYGYKKWLTELMLKEVCGRKSIPHTCLRPAFIYGKYNYAPRESYFFKLVAQNKPLVVPLLPQSLFTMVSVWDVAKIIIACLGNDKTFNRAFNLSAEELICYDRLIEVLEKITGKRFNVQRLSVAKIDADRIPLPFPLDEHLVYSGELIKEALDFQYMSFEEGMTRTYNHFFGIDKD